MPFSSLLAASRRGRAGGPARPALVLGVVLVAVMAINLDTTIVNVALPSLSRQTGASTSDLQWVVDGYTLAFAALVLCGGNLGDRYGRRGTLVGGLVVFAGASALAACCTTVDQLIVARVAMGTGAALIFPTTLSIITTTFPDRGARAKAIGIWGAVAGLGVAVGPVLGGALLDRFWWGSIFLALVPIALIALVGVLFVVPASREPANPAMDLGGLGFSVVALGALVYTVIDAPTSGWLDGRTLVGFALSAALLAAFVLVERSRAHPMLDVRLFANPRFSAASASVAIAFFALFGFIFLITQYFQELRDYSPLGTGVRILPVAASIAVSSLLGTRAAVRWGNKVVVACGLLMLGAGFGWVATAGAELAYPVIVLQMVLLGTGLGLTASPATESIMGEVRPEQAGAGSAVNDATRELGGTLGVAVLGSVFSSLYTAHLHAGSVARVPDSLLGSARSSFAAGQAVSARLAELHSPASGALHDAVTSGFLDGLHAGSATAAGVCVLGAAVVALLLPARPTHSVAPAPSPAAATGPTAAGEVTSPVGAPVLVSP